MRLIEKVWFRGHPAKWLLVPLLLPLTLLFYFISALRRALFTVGLKKSVTLTAPVIVVGNIGIGGNGKTPMVIYLVELTRQLGFKPGVISRGYGGNAPHYPYLLKEDTSANIAGDEPVLIHQRCQVPVAVGSNRIASAQLLIEQGCNVIISDDGLQHYRLARALELIVVDAKRLFGNGFLLPAGPLREGRWRLNKSDLVIFNGSPNTELWPRKLTTPNAIMQLTAKVVCNIKTGERITLSTFVQNNPQVNAIAGIGDPQRFFDTLSAQQLCLNNTQSFVDHHAFCLDDFSHFNDNIPLLMTEKDAVKCYGFSQAHWWYLPVDTRFSAIEQQKITELLITKLAV
ncbi:tetraacyldisaccharide 4'-kinase [Colwellia asteriadis]|uniref:Tetraacyldisaccharide 4'-kinase n=1 Tax=Colwellia asteriadis TaxID=517723 RepID=A0ABN1L9P1_9GAMM